MSNALPDKIINYRIYRDGTDLLGVGTVDLPEISYLSDTLKGAGIGGEIDTPALGQIQALSCTINWRTVTKEALTLLHTKGATLTLRAAQQSLNTATNALESNALKIVLKTLPKTGSLGSLEPGASSGTSTTLEVTYIKIESGDEEILEIDKPNLVCIIGGQDQLADVRAALGG